jgi:formate/nitrite transporter
MTKIQIKGMVLMQDNYFPPAEITKNQCEIGKKKAELTVIKQLLLGLMAGIFVAFASQGYNQAIHTISSTGIAKLVGGTLFTCALMLILIAGGELFTGNCMMLIACVEKRIKVLSMLRSWAVVYLGNMAGSLFIVLLIINSGQLDFSDGMLGAFTIKTAAYKTSLSFGKAICMGILCNMLVCAAVWMASAAKDITGKILAVFFPIWLFVTSGFEHSIANMYFIPAGILAKANSQWLSQALASGMTQEQIALLNIKTFLINNLVPVTLGNIIGGAVLIGLAYWFIYLRQTHIDTASKN